MLHVMEMRRFAQCAIKVITISSHVLVDRREQEVDTYKLFILKPTKSNLPSVSFSIEVESHNEEIETIAETPQRSRQRQRRFYDYNSTTKRLCNPEKTEKIHEALSKLIATNQLPLSLCSSIGF